MSFPPMNKSLSLLVLALPLAGCSSWKNPVDNVVEKITPYQLEIPQGNVVTQDMLAKLKPGMTPSQVRYVLGAPLVVDPFRDNRWDYVTLTTRGGKVTERRRITVVFEQGKLKSVEGDSVGIDPQATIPAKALVK